MPYDWVEPAVFMRHGPHVIYRVYKDDNFQSGQLLYHFSISPLGHMEAGAESGVFDVRELPAWTAWRSAASELGDPPATEDVISDALIKGYFDDWYLENEGQYYGELVGARKPGQLGAGHATKFVQSVTVVDPDTGLPCELEIRKDLANRLLVGLDAAYLQSEAPVFCPYAEGVELIIPDDEELPP